MEPPGQTEDGISVVPGQKGHFPLFCFWSDDSLRYLFTYEIEALQRGAAPRIKGSDAPV